MKRILLILAVIFSLVACGQKGPLYVPDENHKPAKHPPVFIFS